MAFSSILFPAGDTKSTAHLPEKDHFLVDLNLVQIVDGIVSGKEDYNLKPFFYTSLHDRDAILYRQEIMKDIESNILSEYLRMFANSMAAVRRQLPDPKTSYYRYEKERLFLDAVKLYLDAVILLANNLSLTELRSKGFLEFRSYIASYINSDYFTALANESKQLLSGLSGIQYCVLSKELRVQVLDYKYETDYSAEVEKIFEKFKQGAIKDYKSKFSPSPQLNHVEAAILEGVAQLHPEIFDTLIAFYTKHSRFQDEKVTGFDREVQFYISYQEYISRIKKMNLEFCYPEISPSEKNIYNQNGFDLALAAKQLKDRAPVVCNDFYLTGNERIIVVSGPNQGGKTTFARTFGQLHYLASLGCPVPGKAAKLFLFDNLFTHFEKEENIKNLRSKLEDDLIRIHDILTRATPSGIIIMNEILSSTTLQDAVFLSKKIMEKIDALDCLCVWVSFIDELLLLSKKTVSMVSAIVPDNPAVRTFKIERKPADGLAYALSIAEKYHVTYDALKKRIGYEDVSALQKPGY